MKMSWYNDNRTLLSRSNSGNSLRMKGGNPGVHYDDTGRPNYIGRGESSLPRDKSQWRRHSSEFMNYDPTRQSDRGPRSAPYEGSGGGTRGIITKQRFDDYRRETGPPAAVHGIGAVYGPEVPVGGYVERYRKEGTVFLEERIVSHERPWAWPLFLILGLLLLVCGVLTLVFCVIDYYYSQLWTGILLIIFAIVGAFHRGIYRGHKGRWRNALYLTFGILVVLALNFCAAMVLQRLNHVNIQLVELHPAGFIEEEIFRMERLSLEPMVLISDGLETNIWVCYGVDWASIVIVCIGFGALTSVLIIGNNYYNSNAIYRREVEPFCRPNLFNPWGQALLGQAVIFVGMIVKTAAHGNYSTRWQDTWAPVWAGVFPVVGGVLAAFALKRVGLKWGLILVIIAAIVEFLSFLACGAMIGLFIWALTEIIPNFESETLAVTVFSNNLLTWSVVVFVIAIAVMLVSAIFCFALFIRLLWEGCCRDQNEDEQKERRRVYTEERQTESYPRYTEKEYSTEKGNWGERNFSDTEIREYLDRY